LKVGHQPGPIGPGNDPPPEEKQKADPYRDLKNFLLIVDPLGSFQAGQDRKEDKKA